MHRKDADAHDAVMDVCQHHVVQSTTVNTPVWLKGSKQHGPSACLTLDNVVRSPVAMHQPPPEVMQWGGGGAT